MRRGHLHTAAAQEDHGDERPRRVKAVGPARDRSDFAVESFRWSIREARSNVLENAIHVLVDGIGDALEVLKPAVARFGDPESKPAASHIDLSPVEDRCKRFFQQVGSEKGLVRVFEFRQCLLLDFRQVPSALLKRPPRAL